MLKKIMVLVLQFQKEGRYMLAPHYKKYLTLSMFMIVSQVSAMEWVSQAALKARQSISHLVSCCSGSRSAHQPCAEPHVDRASLLGLMKSRHERRAAFASSLYRRSENRSGRPIPLLSQYLMSEICDQADVMELSEFSQEQKDEGLITIIDAIGHSNKAIYLRLFDINYRFVSRQEKDQALCEVCKSLVKDEAKYKISWMVPLFIKAGANSAEVCQQIKKQVIEDMTIQVLKNYTARQVEAH